MFISKLSVYEPGLAIIAIKYSAKLKRKGGVKKQGSQVLDTGGLNHGFNRGLNRLSKTGFGRVQNLKVAKTP